MLVVETGIRPASFRGDLTNLNRMPFVVAALFVALAPRPGCAETSLPWRSVKAPAEPWELLAFAAQKPPGTLGGGETDTTGQQLPPPREVNPPTTPPPTNTPPPSFNLPDTSRHADSIRAFPGGSGAPLETLGGPISRPFTGATSTSLPVGTHRRGLLGVPPLALLAGLIALHIFVVTKVVK